MKAVAALHTPSLTQNTPTSMKRVIISCMIGNALEWYDFVIYGYFADIIGRLFFPTSDAAARLMMTFGIFAAGFLTRPLGAVLFGHLGDRFSRKSALLISIYVMAIPTALIGCIPPYAMIGLWAPLLLTFLRVLQGIAIGGEFTGSMVFMIEHAQDRNRGLAGSWATFSLIAGVVVGSLVATCTLSVLETPQLESWGWRLPFILSLLGSFLGTYMRQHLSDPQTYVAFKNKHKKHATPLKDLFQHHKAKVGLVMLVDFMNAVGFFFLVIFFPTFFKTFLHIDAQTAQSIHTANMLVFGVMTLVGGHLSDLYGRKPFMKYPALFFLIATYPLWNLCQPGDAHTAAMVQTTMVVVMGLFFGALPATLSEIFPTSVRFSGLSIGHNLSMALFGGTAPMVATHLINTTQDLASPAYWLMGMALLTLGSVPLLVERARKPLL